MFVITFLLMLLLKPHVSLLYSPYSAQNQISYLNTKHLCRKRHHKSQKLNGENGKKNISSLTYKC